MISGVLTYSLVFFGAFPHFGVALTGITVSTLLFFKKKEKSLDSILWYVLSLLFSLFILIRVNPFLTLLNFASITYCLSLMALSKKAFQSLINIFLSPFTTFVGTLETSIKVASAKVNSLVKVIGSLTISVVVLIVIIPILSSANPIFGDVFQGVFDFVERLFELDIEFIVTNGFRIVFFLLFIFLIPKLIAFSNSKRVPKFGFDSLEKMVFDIGFGLPKIATIAVLLVFFVTQIQLYFSSSETLQALGYTHSEYAREVFAHLSVVTIVSFLLIYFDRAKDKLSQLTTYILIVQMIFLNLMALKSVNDYISAWGLTHKRLYGLAVVFCLFGLITLFLYIIVKRKTRDTFLQYAALLTGVLLLVINFLNFDRLIYHHGKSTTGQGIDHLYLAKLSPDAGSYKDHLEILTKIKEKEGLVGDNQTAATILVGKVQRLQKQYESFDIRGFNWSSYREYLSIKDYDSDFLDNLLVNTGNTQVRLPNLNVTTEIDSSQSVENKKITVSFEGLPDEFRNANFYLRVADDRNWTINESNTGGSLNGNSFIHIYGTGDFYIYLGRTHWKEGEKSNRISSIEIPYTVTAEDLERGSLTIIY